MSTKDIDRTKPAALDGVNGSGNSPTGAARRRLFRALGRSGAATLGGLLLSAWQKPVIKAVLLPAHAQTSEPTGSPVGCVVTVAVTLSPTGPFGYTAEVVARDSNFVTTTLNSSVFPSGSAALSGAIFLSPGEYDGIFAVSFAGSQPWSYSFEVSCCDTSRGFDGVEPSTVTSFGTGLGANIADDGTCEILT